MATEGKDPSLTKEDDAFVRDRLRWVVLLNNEETIYEDDGRPGVEPVSAWIRLKDYCIQHDFWIVDMWLQFRSNRVRIGRSDAEGYFFVKTAFGVWGDDESYDGYIAGTLHGDKVHVTRYKVPELVELDSQIRPANRESPTLIARRVDAPSDTSYNGLRAE